LRICVVVDDITYCTIFASVSQVV